MILGSWITTNLTSNTSTKEHVLAPINNAKVKWFVKNQFEGIVTNANAMEFI
jgi:hypothetical protein